MRFVILRHETPPGYPRGLHWDLLLEQGEMLRCWALAEEPRPGAEIRAELLPDHRRDYLDYEGPIGGDRGVVRRWDAGRWQLLTATEARWELAVEGERLVAQLVLTRQLDGHWTVIFSPA